MPKTEKKSAVWIDCAKFLAILAVLIDHGKSQQIQRISFRRQNELSTQRDAQERRNVRHSGIKSQMRSLAFGRHIDIGNAHKTQIDARCQQEV